MRYSQTCVSIVCLIAAGAVSQLHSAAEAPDYEAYAHLGVPPLAPEDALEAFELEEGFRIEVVAHEPFIRDPVAMDIDPDGRIWVVEMTSYMPVHDKGEWETAELEQVPEGRVVVLEDTTGDGRMDDSRVFRDELILPRAIKVLDDGILVAEPPNVWFIRDTNGDGKGDGREQVYGAYGDPTSDNVEHMPNGLFWGMDNWLHSSHAGVDSLRRFGGQWHVRPFGRLGQWGMTQDDWGRLYSAHNRRPLQTHLVPYGYGDRHPRFTVRAGKNASIAPGQPMWPAHVTGVNRGYRDSEVREDGSLKRATATCGPVIYRGDQFGDDYRGNAFVPEPAGNLIKRILIDDDPAEIEAEGRFAYEDKEFLTSTDERFRPINMYNAPDGSLYVLDMYRGLFQHARYLTDHLRDYAVEQGLHKPTGSFGRIYRIVREDRDIDYGVPRLSEMTPVDLMEYLRRENGLLRDHAQQLLVQRSPEAAIPLLTSLVLSEREAPVTRLHALWTLEGFDRSVHDPEWLFAVAGEALDDPHPRVRAAAVRILEPAVGENVEGVLTRLEALSREERAPFVELQLLATLGESSESDALRAMARILDRHVESPYFREMALTGVYRREGEMAEILKRDPDWSEEPDDVRASILETLAEARAERDEADDTLDHLTEEQQVLFAEGEHHYRTCMACHGAEGEGQDGVATALAGSEWVQGDPEALVRITLQGFDGEDEEIGAVMPGHGFLSDEAITAVLTYIRQSWGNDAEPVDPEVVVRIREETRDRRETWSADELRELIGQ